MQTLFYYCRNSWGPIKTKGTLSLFLILLPLTITAQTTLKTFNGVYDDGTNGNGRATYTYYEDKKTSEYIKQGVFRYTYRERDNTSSTFRTVTGSYNKGKMNGLWTFTNLYTDWPLTTGEYMTGTETLLANYLNGKPNGAWTYKYIRKTRDKRYSLYGYSWGLYTQLPTQTITANYKNGVISGLFNMKRNGFGCYDHISGQFDSQGNLIGKWIFRGSDEEKVMEFLNGVQINRIVRNLNSGKIAESDIDDKELTQARIDFANKTLNATDLESKSCYLEEIDPTDKSCEFYNFDDFFYTDRFIVRNLSGDDTYGGYSQPKTRNDGHLICISKRRY